MDPQNIHPGVTSTGGDPALKHVLAKISPTKDAGETFASIKDSTQKIRSAHEYGTRFPDMQPRFREIIAMHCVKILAALGVGGEGEEEETGGDSMPRKRGVIVHDGKRGSAPVGDVFPALSNFGTPAPDHMARPGSPARVHGGTPVFRDLERFQR
jgi:hypothetical protein